MDKQSVNGAAPTRHKPTKSTPKPAQAPAPQRKGQLIDSLTAEHGALRHLLTFERDKIEDAKGTTDKDGKRGRAITPEEHFQDPAACELATAVWQLYESRSAYDAETLELWLVTHELDNGYALFYDLQAKARQPLPSWKDCVYAVLNPKKAAKAAEQPATDFPLNDIGNGQRFAALHRTDMRFCGVRNAWLVYERGRWQTDEHGAAEQRAKGIGQEVTAEAARESDDDKRARLLKHALTLTKRATRETMLKDAASEEGMTTTPEQFDRDPHLFNLANGTLNLQTFEFRQHRATDLLTHQSPVVFDVNAKCPTWCACMARWMPDEATRDHVQEMAGASLSGVVFDEFFVFLYGDGDNGKSTFLRVLEWLLGSYSHKTQAETIMQSRDQRQANAPAPELLALKGARLVTVHEIDSKHHLNATLIKDLTGRDAITARGLFEKRPTTFEPQFTLWMFGNGKPQIKDTSGGMWRRPRLIDFGQPIPPQERDPQLAEKLRAELPGILNWTLEGLKRVQQRGLVVPEAVKAATEEYRAEQDPLAGFIASRCVLDPQCSAAAAELWTAWCEWCRENGEREGSQRAFGSELKRRKFDAYRGSTGNRWRGIGLLLPPQ